MVESCKQRLDFGLVDLPIHIFMVGYTFEWLACNNAFSLLINEPTAIDLA